MESVPVSEQITTENIPKTEKVPASNQKGGHKSPAQLELLALARQKALQVRIENSRQRALEKDIADAEKFQKRLAVQAKHKEIFEQKVIEEPEPLPKPVRKKKIEEPEPESDEESEYTYIRVKKSTLKDVVKPKKEIVREESPPPQRAPPPRPRPNSLFSAF
jgi:negative regulator of genetic competence, sporulation and motility